MSAAEVAQIAAAMGDIKAKLEYAMTEVNKVSAAQALVAADANPGANWVNDRLAAQQAAANVVSRDMMNPVNDVTTALNDLRHRVSETEKKLPPHKQKWEMSRPKDMEPNTFGGKTISGRSSKRISWTSLTRSILASRSSWSGP